MLLLKKGTEFKVKGKRGEWKSLWEEPEMELEREPQPDSEGEAGCTPQTRVFQNGVYISTRDDFTGDMDEHFWY